jgi:glycosyltransferase involved in cell wall biosynthesis
MSGTPVITSDHPDNHARVLVTHGVNGWVGPADRDGLVTAIRSVLASPEAVAPDVAAVRETYDWDRLIERLAGVYEARSATKSRHP